MSGSHGSPGGAPSIGGNGAGGGGGNGGAAGGGSLSVVSSLMGDASSAAASPAHVGDFATGVLLAIFSSLFIGASFIIKKKGLKRSSSVSGGVRAGAGGYAYLREPLWWSGMLMMVFGEAANFAAYAFAPALVVTPLGALSIIVSAILAHIFLNEKLNMFGVLGCALCIVGSVVLVANAPDEGTIESVAQVWRLAMQPTFLLYIVFVLATSGFLVWMVAPKHGHTNILVYVAICSLMGSLSVMSIKGLGIAIKLTFEGHNQLVFKETAYCAVVVAFCVVMQMNYLNKALDTFNTALVSPIYYVMFTVLTIVASSIMFSEYEKNTAHMVLMQACGFLVILAAVYLLHVTRDLSTDRLLVTDKLTT
eukprot:CAMPEP_0119191958 /NCGR_PEP_ID=MMETSP1316-20130426/2597_1 /TAXON_ID=41880 /ORGANISM="Pycnococcus provasolii, Strain RCC2336" /LENGTH=363 /DNA_ID=CAMNT_0007187061 /DNA_START=239 /DNA_END=1330 /DNA_ORIENTATION=-